jgi:translocation and assembly module TamA
MLLAALLSVPATPLFADLPYETKIVGAEDSDLADLLDEVSELKTLEERSPASEEALRRRADGDLQRLKDAAHSLGYWSAEFAYEIDTTGDPAKVTVTATPGPLYHVTAVDILGPKGQKLILPLDPSAPSLMKPGDAARTEPVITTENALLAELGHRGYPFAKAGERKVVIDHSDHTMSVTYTLDPGAAARFGPVSINGLERIDPAFVQNRIRWQELAPYDNRTVDATRKALIESGLFSTVKITPVPDPTDPRQVRMDIDATERAHRTVGIGLAYNTSEGPGARLFWENRNLFGYAESLRLSIDAGQQKNGVGAAFRRPDFLEFNQDLLASAEIADDTPVAYRSRRARLSTGIERRFSPELTGGIALGVEKANVTQLASVDTNTAAQATQHYALVGLPLYLKLDKSDDLLNPTRGYRAQANVTPYQSFSGPNLRFAFERVSATTYQRLTDNDRYVIAAFAALSSIQGASLADLPADKRIYAGGGGSIRAYGYQLAGPLDANNKPTGGKSALELSLEARIKITESIGIVPFIDGGSFYRTSVPHFDGRFLFGPGIGFRYYTPIGPLRLDVATPLNRRPNDSWVQVYISLGQAF